MVIECEKCKTRFHLADGRISTKGARVRCSNCHHRFHVKPPAEGADPSAPAPVAAPDPKAGKKAPESPARPAPAARARPEDSAPAASGATRSREDLDLDNPEFLFDDKPPPTEATAPPGDGGPCSVPSLASPEFSDDPAPMLGADSEEPDPDPEEEEPMLGFEPTRPPEAEAAAAPSTAMDDDVPMLEVERNEAPAVVDGPPPGIEEPSFEDVLSRDLDDDDDDTMSGWDALGVGTAAATPGAEAVASAAPTPAPAKKSAPVARTAATGLGSGSDNVLAAAHRTAVRAESAGSAPTKRADVDAEYEAPAWRPGRAIVQGLAVALALVVSAGGVRLVGSHGVGGVPGPSTVSGAGWTARDIQAFHVHDQARRRILVLRGLLSADSATPPPRVQVTLLDDDGRIVGAPVRATLKRLGDAALTPEAVAALLEPSSDAQDSSLTPPAAPAEEPNGASGARAGGDSAPLTRETVDGFTVLVPDPPQDARRFYLELSES